MCLNFVEDGSCYATRGKCILGAKGASVQNEALECELHGGYDVWVMQDEKLLVTDLGFPSEEPKQCLALGINSRLADQIALSKSHQLGTSILTTQRKCIECGKSFWVTEHDVSSRAHKAAKGYFCPKCILHETEKNLVRKLGALGYWCG